MATSQRQLNGLTATQAVDLILRRKISVLELVEALLAGIEATDHKLGAWALVAAHGARAAAAQCDLQISRGDTRRRCLHGVPFGVKDVIDVEGLPTQAGFDPFRERTASADAAVVAALRRQGGIVLGKTTTAQLAFADPPGTVNPWAEDRSPGGSSSGSAAAVAARQVPLALATQTGGSTLRPAAFTGCVGFKPSHGRVGTEGLFPLAWSLDTVGVITRSVEDCQLFLSAAAPPFHEQVVRLTRPPRLGCIKATLERSEPDVQAGLEESIRKLTAAGAAVEMSSLSHSLDEIWAVHQVIMQSEAAAAHWHLLPAQREAYRERLRSFLEVGRNIAAAVYINAQRVRRQIREDLEAEAARFDALLLPGATSVAPALDTTGDSLFQTIFSLTGMPTISLPSGLSPMSLPLAVQLAGPLGKDRQLLEVASWCSAVLGALPEPPVYAGRGEAVY